MQYLLKQGVATAAAAADQHPIRIGQAGQGLGGFGFEDAGGVDLQPSRIGANQGCSPGPSFDCPELQLGPQPQGLQSHRTHPRSHIPEHPALGQLKVSQELNSYLALGHQTGLVFVLQPQAVCKAKEGQGLGCRDLWRFGDQHHQVQPINVAGQGFSGGKAAEPFVRVAEPFCQPKAVGRLQARTGQEAPHA